MVDGQHSKFITQRPGIREIAHDAAVDHIKRHVVIRHFRFDDVEQFTGVILHQIATTFQNQVWDGDVFLVANRNDGFEGTSHPAVEVHTAVATRQSATKIEAIPHRAVAISLQSWWRIAGSQQRYGLPGLDDSYPRNRHCGLRRGKHPHPRPDSGMWSLSGAGSRL